MDYNLPGSSLHGILQARIVERVPFPSPGDLLDPEIEPRSPPLQADFLLSELVDDYGQQVLWETFNCIDAYFCRLKKYLDTCYLFSPLILSFFSYF